MWELLSVRAPLGSMVGLYYDAPELDLDDGQGHALVTPTGRVYQVVTARRQLKGKHVGRWHLRCLVSDDATGAKTHPLTWYRR